MSVPSRGDRPSGTARQAGSAPSLAFGVALNVAAPGSVDGFTQPTWMMGTAVARIVEPTGPMPARRDRGSPHAAGYPPPDEPPPATCHLGTCAHRTLRLCCAAAGHCGPERLQRGRNSTME